MRGGGEDRTGIIIFVKPSLPLHTLLTFMCVVQLICFSFLLSTPLSVLAALFFFENSQVSEKRNVAFLLLFCIRMHFLSPSEKLTAENENRTNECIFAPLSYLPL